jgi:hypothetical protein
VGLVAPRAFDHEVEVTRHEDDRPVETYLGCRSTRRLVDPWKGTAVVTLGVEVGC